MCSPHYFVSSFSSHIFRTKLVLVFIQVGFIDVVASE